MVVAAGLAGAWPRHAQAAPNLTIQQITWSTIGLDSNTPTDGPSDFPVGVRVCNIGSTATGNLRSTFTFTSANAFITLLGPGTDGASIPAPFTGNVADPGSPLAAGQCVDIYYSVSVQQVAAAYDTGRTFTITVSDGAVSATTGQQLFIEHLISQNRNSTLSITGPTNVLVGNSYTWTVTAFTATQGYEELEHFLTFCPDVYRLDSVTTSYTAPAPFTDDTFWADGCSWDTSDNVGLPSREGCLADPGIKYGGDIVYNYNVTIIGEGACTLRDMVYDFSGSSYHYNTDYSDPSLSFPVVATSPVCATGRVYKDINPAYPVGPNHTYEAGLDTPVVGYTVTAYQDSNDNGAYDAGSDLVAATTTTDGSGIYNLCVTADSDSVYFVGVNTGDAAVSGFTLNPNITPRILGDGLDPYIAPPSGWTGGTGFTLDQVVDFDFDPIPPPGGFSGFLYADNGAGGGTALDLVKNGGEPGFSGQTVTYYRDDGDGIFEPIAGQDGTGVTTAATGASGQYSTSGLTPGNYWILAPATIGTNAVETTGPQPNPRLITVTSGATNTTNTDFGYAASGGITGFLYRDDGVGGGTALDNINDPLGEAGIASLTVTYYRDVDNDSVFEPGGDDGAALGTATTNGSGQYSITGLAAGNYWVQGPASAGTYTVGTTNPVRVTVTSGATNSAAANDIGYDPPAPASPGTISGSVYLDNSPQNDSYDILAENGIDAVTITIYLDDGDGIFEPGAGAGRDGAAVAIPASVGGDIGQGAYSASGLAPGNYWLDAPATAGSNTLGTSDPLLVTVPSGGGSSNNNFGYDPAATPGGISGTVYEDFGGGGGTVGNNAFDSGSESTINSVTVSLYLDDGDGVFEPGAGDGTATTTSTAGAGAYSFASLTPGNYWISVPNSITGSRQIGTTDPLFVTVPSGTTVTNQNFGYDPNSRGIIVTAFRDDGVGGGTGGDNLNDTTGEAGVSAISIELFRDVDNDGVFEPGGDDGAALSTGATDANGQISFPNLSNLSYFVRIVTGTIPAGLSIPGGEVVVTVNSPSNNPYTSVLFPLDPTGATITGRAFRDDGAGVGGVVADDIQNGSEAAIPNMTVTLYNNPDNSATLNGDETVAATTTTNASGDYTFTGQTVGNNYLVDIDQTDPDKPSNYTVGATDPAQITSLTAGTTTRNFPFDPPGTISGTAFQDNGAVGGTALNNVKDGGESGISGLTVTLYVDTNGNGTYEAGTDTTINSMATPASGAYGFSGLAPGTYRVNISPTTSGSYTLPSGENNSAALALTAGGTQTANFAYDPPGTVTGTLFKDDGGTTGTAGNNTQNGDEGGIGSGIIVTLRFSGANGAFGDGDDTTVSTTTDSAGGYTFSNVAISANPYRVEVAPVSQQVGNYLLPTAELNSTSFTVTSGSTTSRSFAYDPLGVIAGTAFRDDGVGGGTALDDLNDATGEAGIPNVTVTLYNDLGIVGAFEPGTDTVVTTTTTDSSGNFSFGSQPIGNYWVDIDQVDPDVPSGYSYFAPPADPRPLTPLAQGTTTILFPFDPPGTVTGTIFRDLDNNGAQGGGEAGIPNISVTLTHGGADNNLATAGDNLTFTTTTNASGVYTFTNIPPGNIQIDAAETDTDMPSGYTLCSAGTACTDPVTTTTVPGGTVAVNFGFRPPTGTISGTVFQDDGAGASFGNGVQDGGEAGIDNITVTLYNDVNGNGILDAGDTVAATTSTSGGGAYSFTNLGPSNYLVDVSELDPDVPANYINKSTDPLAVNLPLNGTSSANNFGFVPPPVIRGTVYRDLNMNDIQDAGEPGISGIDVTIPGVGTISTDANGDYLFDSGNGLAPGTYSVDVNEADPQLPAGYIPGTTDPVSGVMIAAGSVATINFGFDPPAPATINGTVWLDDDADTLIDVGEIRTASVTVTLYNNPDDSAAPNGDETVVTTTTTDGTGAYSFTGLAAGNYLVGVTQTDPPIPTGSALTTGANPRQVSGLAAGATSTNNFGFDPPALATISGTVWNDADGSTTINGVETGIGGVTVSLYRDNGDGVLNGSDTLVGTTTSAVSGAYSFTGLAPSTYWVVESDPAGYVSTTPNTVSNTVAAGGAGTVNFGDQQASNTVSGVVFLDADNDTLRDAGEPGINGVTVELRNALGVTIATTTTDAGGNYSFSGAPNGTYTVVETDPTGYSSTTPNNVAVAVPGGGTANANFGDRITPGSITGRVFNDNGNGGGTASDGVQNGSEAGIASVTVQAFRDVNSNDVYDPATDTLVSTTTTNASGDYTFTNLPPGDYVVVETDPIGYYSVTPNTQTAVVTGGAMTANVNFADQFPPPPATVVGTVWNDLDGDGALDPGEAGIPGATLALYQDTNGNGMVDPGEPMAALTTSDAGGSYSFSGVAAGSYIVVETNAPGYTGNTTPNSVAMTLTAGGTGTAAFGDQAASGMISGTVWGDVDGNGLLNGAEAGLGGVTVALYRDTNGNGVLDPGLDTLAGTTSTAGGGGYSFAGLAPGSYLVVETDPAGYTSTTPNQLARTIPAGGSATADFGDQPLGNGTISGTVWSDTNNNAALDAGELGIGSVTIRLYSDTNGNGAIDSGEPIIATTSTNAGGTYNFTGLPNGNYVVQEVNPTGYQTPGSTPDVVGRNITNNSQIVNFGDVPDPGALGGTFWNDVNSNGVINLGENGISGVTISLYNDVNGNGVFDSGVDTLSATTITGPLGTYSFPSNTPGAYLVIASPPAGYTSTTPMVVSQVISPGNSKIVNFGATTTPPAGTVFGTVWNDLDGDGLIDPGEGGLPGVTVQISDGVTTLTTVTNASGGYTFTGLGNGTWTVTEVDPAGYVSTTSNTASVVLAGGFGSANFGDRVPPPAPPPGGGSGGGGGGGGPVATDPPITKSGNPANAGVGDIVTFIIVAFNPNTTPFTNVVVSDTMPGQVTLLSVSSTGGTVSVNGNSFTVTIGTMAPGQRVTITVVTRVNNSVIPPATIRNSARLSSDQGVFDADATVTVAVPACLGCPALPPTGERPLWVRFAGPLTALAAGVALLGAGLGWAIWQRKGA